MARQEILGTDTVKDAFLTKNASNMGEAYVNTAEVVAGRDGETTLLAQVNALQALIDAVEASIAALVQGSGIPISANDTTAGVLNGKALAGEAIILTEGNDGGDETLTWSCEDATVTNKGVASFPTAQFTASSGAVTIRSASTTQAGVRETATAAEARGGSAIDKFTTPANLGDSCFPRVLAKTAAHTVAAVELIGNVIFTNKSAGVEVNFTLIAALVGMSATYEVRTAQYLKCTAAGAETIEYNGSSGAAGGYVRSNVAGTSWKLECREAGTWTLCNIIGLIRYDE